MSIPLPKTIDKWRKVSDEWGMTKKQAAIIERADGSRRVAYAIYNYATRFTLPGTQRAIRDRGNIDHKRAEMLEAGLPPAWGPAGSQPLSNFMNALAEPIKFL